MTVKKLMFCVLCFANAANLATEEDFNDENSSNSKVEENINKNNWNTRKWGSIYILFSHVSFLNISNMFAKDLRFSCIGKLEKPFGIILNVIISGVVEYKWLFHRYWGINVRLNVNNLECLYGSKIEINNEIYKEEKSNNEKGIIVFSIFSIDIALEWVWGRKGKKVFSGSISPVGLAWLINEKYSPVYKPYHNMFTWSIILLKYEYDKRFYLNFGKIKGNWRSFCDENNISLLETCVVTALSIEFGLNIVGVDDWRRGKKNKILKMEKF